MLPITALPIPVAPALPRTAIQQPGAAADSVAAVAEWIRSALGLGADTQLKILLSLVAVGLIYLLRRILLRVVFRKLDEPRIRYQWSKTSGYLAFGMTVLVIVQIWVEAIRNLGTFLGLLSAGLAIALKDLVANLAGWGFIIWRRPFELGDRVQIGLHAGDVVDIRIFQFTVLEIGNWVDADQSTGRLIHVPNARLFTEPLANYTAQFAYLWHEIPVLLTFESDWRRAKDLLVGIVNERTASAAAEAERAMRQASRKVLIFYAKLTPTVYTSVKENGILLTVRYLCRPRERRGTEQAVWEAALEAFAAEPGISLAYPTRRVFVNPLEGREAPRAPVPRPEATASGEEDRPLPEGPGRG